MSLPHDTGPPSNMLEPHTTEPNLQTTSEQSHGKARFTIDFSLDLERQLEMEASSPPPTPSASASSYSQLKRDSLDPQVLVYIIAGLRKNIEDMTRERDDLLKLLESATTREASLQDTLALMTEKATDYEEELSTARKKMKDDEEAIVLLRNKVEESRRGLMRIQAESRRQSAAPGSLDLSRAGIPGLTSPPSAKRASFTPLTGRSNGHRRVSSISHDGNGLGVLLPESLNPSPNGQLSFQEPPSTGLGPPGSRRSLFLRQSPPNQEIPLPPAMANEPFPELESLKKELENLKKELSNSRAELAEANEAKEASDMCVKVLREFITDNQVGEHPPVKVPPLPTMTNGGDKPVASNIGWGFKLWKADSTPKAPVFDTASVSSSSSVSTPITLQTPTNSATFSRFGGFFSSRASISSTTSSGPVLQSNATVARDSFRDSISGHSISTSDVSSVVEPASPEHEHKVNVKVVLPGFDESVGVNDALGMPVEKDISVQSRQHTVIE